MAGELGLPNFPESPQPPQIGPSLLFWIFIGFAIVGVLALLFRRRRYLIGATIGTIAGFFAGLLAHSPASFGLGMIGAFLGFLVPTVTIAIVELSLWIRMSLTRKPQQATETRG